MKKILLIIPAYNEEKNLPGLLEELKKYPQYDVLVINDCSADNTLKILRNSSAKYIDLPVNLGIGGAVQTGYIFAYRNDYDIAVQVDGDGQHDPKYIEKLTQAVTDGADMAIGSRFLEGKGFQSTAMRRVGINYLSFLIKRITGHTVKDPTSGFRACGRNMLEFFAGNYPQDYPEPETVIQALSCEYTISEIPVLMRERKAGKSSINPLKSVYYMIKVTIAMFICSKTQYVARHRKDAGRR
jgi:glycosyltransferase involved in cell wall biosynthesis